jgi:hypothetical protein
VKKNQTRDHLSGARGGGGGGKKEKKRERKKFKPKEIRHSFIV